jgi:hypothetical protein
MTHISPAAKVMAPLRNSIIISPWITINVSSRESNFSQSGLTDKSYEINRQERGEHGFFAKNIQNL